MTVARLQRELSFDELIRWQTYYGRKAQREEIAMKKAEGKR